MKLCTKCHIEKERSAFYARDKSGSLRQPCRECHRSIDLTPEQQHRRRLLNKLRMREMRRDPTFNALEKTYKADYSKRYWQDNKERLNSLNRLSYQANKEARKEWQRNYTKDNQDKVKDTDLKRHYGITLEQYNELHASQSGLCAICQQPETATYKGKIRMLCVDHNHDTGEIRQLLCNICNTAIGYFNEDPKLLSAAIRYLNRHQHKSIDLAGIVDIAFNTNRSI